MAVDAFLLALALALLLGGRFRNLGRLPLRGLWMGGVLFAVLFVASVIPFVGVSLGVTRGLYLGAQGVLIGLLLWNWRVPGLGILALGLGLNFLVIAANGGYMPVDRAAAARLPASHEARLYEGKISRHSPMTAETRLATLGDRFVFPFSLVPPYPQPLVFSVGDALMTGGIVWVVLVGMGVPLVMPRARKKQPPQ